MKRILTITYFCCLAALTFGQNNVEIPNVFTPNGDGINDVFEINLTGYSTVKCSIFNRYGGLVYQYYGAKGFWDGRSHAGMECTDGTYFVILELEIEGGEKITYQGDLQLLR